MSRFQVGDKVRCVNAESISALTSGCEYTVSRVEDGHDERVCLDAFSDNDWWYASRFELIPAESPDDWVTQDIEPDRPGIDEWRWSDCTTWYKSAQHLRRMHGDVVDGFTFEARCRRKDLPVKPAETLLSSGGPYVARSEYERVCLERDNAVEAHKKIQDAEVVKPWQEVERLQKQVDSCMETIEGRDLEIDGLRKQLEDVTGQRDRFKASWKKEFDKNLTRELYGLDENDWPLVPVDPSCIPAGHRAVEVTAYAKGKIISSNGGSAMPCTWVSVFPRLVVEPIPPEQPSPGPLPVPEPEPPAWLRSGWWYWCGSDGYWCIGENQPVWDGTRWSPAGGHTGIHTSDMCHPIDKSRASEACWQVK